MSAHHVSGYGLRRALIAGSQRVLRERDEINRINVYPVADHDTGTNLAFTLGGVLQGLREPCATGAGELLARAATESADSARGNSGVILAQFLQGAAESLKPGERLTGAKLAQAVSRGATLARAAMASPRESTMVTVIQAFADEWQQQAATPDLRHGFAAALARAQAALRQTRQQIPTLRSAGVVDAGALGFVCLLEGKHDYITRGRRETISPIPADLVSAGVDVSRIHAPPGLHRYRASCVINAERVDCAGLKADLLALSLDQQVISGTREQVRLHARTDDPAALFRCAATYGTLAWEKVTDLQSPGAQRPVGIATDTGADLPAEEVARLEIHLVPQRLSVNGQDHIDRVSITPSEFFRAMRHSQISPRTSQPAPGDFRRLFEFMLTQHESVIDVSLTRTLSGTRQSAENMAKRTAPGRVHVFDSGSVSCGQGLLAIWAAEAAQAGLDAPAILAGLERMRSRTRVFAFVEDIQYAVRGGRAPRIAQTLTRLLHFSLLLKIKPNGRLGLFNGLWGGQNLPERFAHTVGRRLDPARRYRVIIGHSDCAAEAQRVQTALQASGLILDRCWVVETGVAIGAHAGPGSLVIGVQDYEAPGK